MPYEIVRNHPQCPVSKPFGLVKQGEDKPVACHDMRVNAMAQMAAIMKSEQTQGK